MSHAPQVSVVMPVFNTAAYVGQAIESILQQTYQNFEFIIIDDASHDNSVKIINTYRDERIRFISNSFNQGISKTRNQGMAKANGKYIAVFDSDDISLPYRLEKQVAFLENNPEFGLIGGQVIPIDEQGTVIGDTWQFTAEPEEIPVILLFRNYFAQPSVMLRATAIANQWYDPTFITAGDYEYWTRIIRRTKVWNLNGPLIQYRRHSEGITRRTDLTNSLQSIKRIIANQLAHLGITLAKAELILFQELARTSYDPKRIALKQRFKRDKQSLESCFRLLDTIEKANSHRNIYDLAACEKVLKKQKRELTTLYAQTRYLEADKHTLHLLTSFFFLLTNYIYT